MFGQAGIQRGFFPPLNRKNCLYHVFFIPAELIGFVPSVNPLLFFPLFFSEGYH